MLQHWIRRLYQDFDLICFSFNVVLPKPLITVAAMKGRWGSFDPLTRAIVIAEELILGHRWDAVVEVLKHEMAHYLVRQEWGDEQMNHGAEFKAACRRLGISGWAAASDAELRAIPDWRTATGSDEDERLMRRVEKLMALASSDNEHEAYLAMERVRELYLKHNLERLAAKSTEDFVHLVIMTGRKRVPREQQLVFSILNSHYFVEVIQIRSFDAILGEECQAYEILGTARNVRMAEYVYHFLMNNVPLLWRAFQKRTTKDARLRRSYCIGVLRGFDDKLTRQTEAMGVPVPNADSAALVMFGAEARRFLREADRQLRAFVRFRHPKIVTKGAGATSIDRDTYAAGLEDGARLTVNRPITSTHRGPTRYLLP